MRRPLAVLALLASPLCACQSTADRTGQTTRGFFAPDFDTLWQVAEDKMRGAGYTIDREESGKEGRVMVSRWNTRLMPFSNQGTREQVTIYLHDVPGREKTWSVEANAIRQTNRNLKEPSNPIRAQWDDGVRIPEVENRLAHEIETFFLGYDVSPEFRARYGMPPGRKEVPAPDPTGAGAPSSAR